MTERWAPQPIVKPLACAYCERGEKDGVDLVVMSMTVSDKQFGWVFSCEAHIEKTVQVVSVVFDDAKADDS